MLPETAPITASTLEPLTRLVCLRRFMIDSNRPIETTDDQLADLLECCPSVTSLHLAPEPVVLSDPLLTIDVLRKLALRGSKIEKISLYVDTSNANYRTLEPGLRLQSLTAIQLGYSQIRGFEVEKVAMYLAHYRLETGNLRWISHVGLLTPRRKPGNLTLTTSG